MMRRAARLCWRAAMLIDCFFVVDYALFFHIIFTTLTAADSAPRMPLRCYVSCRYADYGYILRAMLILLPRHCLSTRTKIRDAMLWRYMPYAVVLRHIRHA